MHRAEAIPSRGLLSQSTQMQHSTGLRPWWMIPSNARCRSNSAGGAAVSAFLPKGEHFMSTTPIVPTPPAGGTTPTSGSPLPNPQSLNNMFLQLLVAQLKSQSPLNPMDPTQFVGQLAQFSELSEVTQIEQILQQAVLSKSASVSTPAQQPTNVPSGSPKNQESVPVPAAMASAAVAAAQAMVHNWSAPQASILNSKI